MDAASRPETACARGMQVRILRDRAEMCNTKEGFEGLADGQCGGSVPSLTDRPVAEVGRWA